MPSLIPQPPSDIRLLRVLDIEKEKRGPINLWETLDLVIQDGLYFPPFQLRRSVSGGGRLDCPFVLAPPRGGSLRFMCHTVSNSMKPIGQRLLLADARTSPGQEEEGCLECVLCVLMVVQDMRWQIPITICPCRFTTP